MTEQEKENILKKIDEHLYKEVDKRIDSISKHCGELDEKYPSTEYVNSVGVASEKAYWNGQRQALHQIKQYLKECLNDTRENQS